MFRKFRKVKKILIFYAFTEMSVNDVKLHRQTVRTVMERLLFL